MIYAMSDIHGFDKLLKERVEQLGILAKLEGGTDKLIFLGDYIDGGPQSCQVLETVYKWQQKYGENRVVVLRGNHDWFANFLNGDVENWLGADRNLNTSSTFLKEEELDKVMEYAAKGRLDKVYPYIRRCIFANHGDLIRWMKNLPYYYETDTQIFVHAGVDEEAGDLWRDGTPEYIFTGKYPASTGKFYKDIIAGHISTAAITGVRNYHDIYHDGASHYYIDGATVESGVIPVLAYDEKTGKYRGI